MNLPHHLSIPFLLCWLVLSALLLTGCQSTIPESSHYSSSLSDPAYARSALYEQYQEWKGVPYRDGGESRRGVDCSGFIQLTFREQFAIRLPRDTGSQAQLGRSISARQLRPGDLVFFHIGKQTRHVGVVVEKNKFLHASTSKGVMISDLNQPYWQRSYWQARRLSQ
ncbi:MAG: glycoside hydrolase [Gammaproteobacteria bacterium]|uniref:Cell wall-associated NlpC family hydrolase n=1 Tax=Tolumonas osonensis TaxID=675874 RepID=A0A841GG80_9GAMM|nr:NlpC/P60 family protein [Tolumonas osonensis]MBB6054261.1 cell wall-associated NlpC family hydrolase [Tolumonas osonensis]NCB60452.1 glycoside hydrolase [Gammaproteobacteria bacterium]